MFRGDPHSLDIGLSLKLYEELTRADSSVTDHSGQRHGITSSPTVLAGKRNPCIHSWELSKPDAAAETPLVLPGKVIRDRNPGQPVAQVFVTLRPLRSLDANHYSDAITHHKPRDPPASSPVPFGWDYDGEWMQPQSWELSQAHQRDCRARHPQPFEMW